MKRTITRFLALALCLITLLSFAPALASADTGEAKATVEIESQTNSAFDYLEYYSGGKWKDLNTPKHWIKSTGQVCYCIEHTDGNPHGATYTAAAPSSVFGTNTLAGLQTILMYGYPCNTPDGFTEDEARQATANAIRFWLSENGEPGSYSFTNRKTHPDAIRAKKGYEHVLTWADELLQMARDKKKLSHNIEFTPASLTLSKRGDNFTGKTTVKLTNINSGYTLDTSGLPTGVTVTGYTGNKTEQLTITAPMSAAGKTFTISATGKDTRSLDNITAYIPSNDSLQKIFLCATTAQVVATASFGVNTPALGALKIKKVGDDSTPLAGVKFGIYKDANCSQKVTEVTTGNDGTVTVSDLDAGTYYVKELSTVRPYVVDGLVHSVIVVVSETTTLELENETAKGAIKITKTAYVLTGTTATATEYGQLHSPKYEVKGLPGCVFEVKNASGTVVATLTTDETGTAETPLLPFGTYTVQETATVTGYDLDASIYTVTLAYKDQNTPIVYAEVSATNKRIPGSIKIKKTCEFFDTETMTFKVGPLAGAVFGVYTAETIKVIPKNTLVDILTTDENGVATSVTTLPFGKYYLKELKVPDETIHLIEESFPVTVAGANSDYFKKPIENERFKGNIAIWKEDDSNPGRMLEGAQYEIRDKNGLLYVTENTFDSYMWQTIEAKQKFIGQIMTSKSPARSCEDVDETALSYAEVKALATGNPHIKEKMDLEVQVSKLKLLKSNYLSMRYSLEDRLLKKVPKDIRLTEENIAGCEADMALYAQHKVDGFAGMTVSGTAYGKDEKKDAGVAILAACKAKTSATESKIGTYMGFDLFISYDSMSKVFKMRMEGTLSYRIDLGEDAYGNITRMDNALASIPARKQGYERTLSELHDQGRNLKEELEKPFPQEDELREKTDRLTELDALLNLDKHESDAIGEEDEDREEDAPERSNDEYER